MNYITITDETGDLTATAKQSERIIIRRRPTFIKLLGDTVPRFRYCNACTRPVFDLSKLFCSDRCKEIVSREKAQRAVKQEPLTAKIVKAWRSVRARVLRTES